MRHEFTYFQKGNQWFPIIAVTLRHKDKKITVRALVDSGASFSIFHAEIAAYLGINITTGKKIRLTGIGGKILDYLHTIQLTLANTTFTCKMIFSKEFNISFNLLGRDNFFIPFTISFMEKEKKILIDTPF